MVRTTAQYLTCINSHPPLVLTVPVGLSGERLSATQMRVSWSLQEGFSILFYTIKYYAVNETVRERRDVVNNIKFINTTKNITIHNLHPTFSYSVSVAANTISGRGNFSDEIKVGCEFPSICMVLK